VKISVLQKETYWCTAKNLVSIFFWVFDLLKVRKETTEFPGHFDGFDFIGFYYWKQ